MSHLNVEYFPLTQLRPFKQNARLHSDRQITQIAASIKAFGFNNPILIDAQNTVIAGHGRLAAAKQLNMSKVPVIRLEHMGEDELRAYVLADNRLAEKAGWDEEVLSIELQHLTSLDLDFEIEATGFETAEIDLLLDDGFGTDGPEKAGSDDMLAEPDFENPAVSRRGDLWQMGEHRLLCADCLARESFPRLLDGGKADLVFTDPPYNVPVAGHVSGLGRNHHREFAMASGEMNHAEFAVFLGNMLAGISAHARSGALFYICMDWRHTGEMEDAIIHARLAKKNICIWVKPNGGMGSLYRSRHELVYVLKNGSAPHINNIQLGRHGRNRTNVWEYAGASSFGKNREAALSAHPTVKPVGLVADAIRDASRRRDLVLDPFGGSGTTLIAAERTGRRARLAEIDPHYCDASIGRWQRLTGLTTNLVDTGETFEQVAARRLEEQGDVA